MVLNMLTTGAMVRTGKTYGNLMVDVQTGSEKLKDRARRIITIVTGLEYDEADKLLRRARWNVKGILLSGVVLMRQNTSISLVNRGLSDYRSLTPMSSRTSSPSAVATSCDLPKR